MVKKTYFYLGEQNIGIEAPNELLERVGRNFEETPFEKMPSIGDIRIEEGDYTQFSRDRSKKYLTTRDNTSRSYLGIDFLRYGVLVRTVWKVDQLHYEIQNFLPLDETAALSCFKKVYYATPSSKDKALVHGSLVKVGGEGILICGECWSGKTSLTMNFLEKFNGELVSDGNVFLSYTKNGLIGYYLPKPVFVRFHSISSSQGLSSVLTNPEEAESTQPFDREAIEEIIAQREYDLDAGLNFSRKKFAELVGIRTLPICEINKIIHTKFDSASLPIIRLIGIEEDYGLLLAREFLKDMVIGNIKHQREIGRPDNSIIKQNWLDGVEMVGVSFDARKNLTKNLLEDLICFH